MIQISTTYLVNSEFIYIYIYKQFKIISVTNLNID